MLTPMSDMALYQWGSMTAEDYFCPTCGILPLRRPSDPTSQEIRDGIEPFDGWAINVRCLDGLNIKSLPVHQIPGSRIRYE